MPVTLALTLIRMRPSCMFFTQGNVNRNRKVFFLLVHDVHNGFCNVQLRLVTVVQRFRLCEYRCQ